MMSMKSMTVTMCGAAALLAIVSTAASAQTKTIGTTETVTATVEAIDHPNREVTVKTSAGKYEVLYMPESMKRFESLKVGDKVTAKYYENMVLQVKAPGSKDVNTATGGTVRAANGTAGTVSHQRTITATIAAIDMNVPSITFTGPEGWKYSSRVQDKKALASVKVGDKVDITWTAAMVLSVDAPK
jgi:hypothetical protein